MRQKLYVLLAIVSIASQAVFADGWVFIKGRFPSGRVSVFKLTPGQRDYLDLIRRCQKDNERTPYLFRLTDEQASLLRRQTGFSPDRFAVFESYRGDKGVDLEVNVINRFSEDEFEIPHKLLTRNRTAQNWEVHTMGWSRNPLSDANPADYKSSCPVAQLK